PDAEEEASVRELIDGGDLLGEPDRVALGDETDPGGELQRRRGGRDCGEREELIVGPPVELGKRRRAVAPAPRRCARRRDMAVFGEPQRLEAALFDGTTEFDRLDRLIGGEDEDAE